MPPGLREPGVAVVINRHDLPDKLGDWVHVNVEEGVGEDLRPVRFRFADSLLLVGERGLRDDNNPTT